MTCFAASHQAASPDAEGSDASSSRGCRATARAPAQREASRLQKPVSAQALEPTRLSPAPHRYALQTLELRRSHRFATRTLAD